MTSDTTNMEQSAPAGKFYAPNIIARMFRTFLLYLLWVAIWLTLIMLVPKVVEALNLYEGGHLFAVGIIFGPVILLYYFVKDFRNKTAETCRLYYRRFILKAFFYSMIAVIVMEVFGIFSNLPTNIS